MNSDWKQASIEFHQRGALGDDGPFVVGNRLDDARLLGGDVGALHRLEGACQFLKLNEVGALQVEHAHVDRWLLNRKGVALSRGGVALGGASDEGGHDHAGSGPEEGSMIE